MATRYNTRGTLKQDLTAARAELKQFRHDIALLKKKGILQKGFFDARSVTPTKYLKKIRKEFNAVLKGEAQTVKVNKKTAAYYKKKGYKVKNSRVAVPTLPNEKVYGTHGKFVVKAKGNGGSLTRIEMNLPTDDVHRWAEVLKSRKVRLKKNERFAIQFKGYNTHTATFESLEQVADYMMRYDMFEWAAERGSEEQSEFIDDVVIFRVERNTDGTFPRPSKTEHVKEIDAETRRRNEERNRARYNRRLNSMTPEEETKFHAERRAYMKNKRATMSPEKKADYKAAAKARAAQSRANKKAK